MTNFYGSHASWPKVRVVAALDPAPVDPGTPPVDGVPAWEASKVYTAGNKVSHKGVIYQAKWWTQGNEPGKGSLGTGNLRVSTSASTPGRPRASLVDRRAGLLRLFWH